MFIRDALAFVGDVECCDMLRIVDGELFSGFPGVAFGCDGDEYPREKSVRCVGWLIHGRQSETVEIRVWYNQLPR